MRIITVWPKEDNSSCDNCRRPAFGVRQYSQTVSVCHRLRLKCDGTQAETRFRLSEKRTGPSKSTGASVQSATGRRVVHISDSNAGHTTFRGSVKSTGYPLHSPVSPSLSLPCVTVCHHVSTGLYRYALTALHLAYVYGMVLFNSGVFEIHSLIFFQYCTNLHGAAGTDSNELQTYSSVNHFCS